jgi:hypothetical protein
MRNALIFALLVSGVPAAAAAKPEAGSAATGRKKIICIEDTVTGSRLSTKRVCKTAEEWKQDSIDARQMLERAHRSQTNPTG